MRSPALLATLLLLAACSRKDTPPSPAPPPALTSHARAEEDVGPVYRVDPAAADHPLAKKLCEGLTGMPEAKRAACCKATPGIVMTSECTRTLSAALATRAVTLDPVAVDRCLAAFERTLEGCDWVGPFAPGPPAECQGIVEGTLAEGATCRSSLECAGSLRCHGAGPTSPGKCGRPKADGELCGASVDTLATYVRQSDVDRLHPECKERCTKHRCAPAAVEGATCATTAECNDGLQCIAGPTAARTSKTSKRCLPAPPAKEGEPCRGGICEHDLACIKGTCSAPKKAGDACTSDFECRGGCLRSDLARAGTCGPRCDLR